ncbi:MAG: GNAT family N-acetyltransferase [Gemmobacter sp.]|uniref:GNAT family N-acetyltransferase n=1 Tax=Gemmobacter sp. TaxID=1898957 RepID=UPI0039197C7F
MTPTRATPRDWPAVLALTRAEFAYMDGVIDPPSALHRLTLAEIERQAETGKIWAIGASPVACVSLTTKADALFIGKLAVAAPHRRQGHAKALIDMANRRATGSGLPWLELQTRVELAANQATFRHLGFAEVGRTAHAGYDRPMTITFRRSVVA